MSHWLLALLLTGLAWAQPGQPLELVESVPLETEAALDDPEIRSTQEVWVELVNSAQATLDLEFFYLRHEPKTVLEPVVQAVERAHARGVKVRVLVDAKFLVTYPELCSRWSQLGVEVRKIKFPSGVQHAKLLLADDDRFFLGSQNFDWTALSHIRELGLHGREARLKACYQQVFEHDWAFAAGQESAPASSPVHPRAPLQVTSYGQPTTVYPVFSPVHWSQGSSEESALVSLLKSAQKTVEVQVMSYSPVVVSHPGDGELPKRYETLDMELRAAAARGVQVRLLVSDWGTKPPHRAALQALSTVPNLEIKVSHIPPWSGGEIPFSRVGHSKYLVVDGQRGWIGTSNWEYSYFHTSRDLGLVFDGPGLAAKVHQFFQRDWEGPYVRDL